MSGDWSAWSLLSSSGCSPPDEFSPPGSPCREEPTECSNSSTLPGFLGKTRNRRQRARHTIIEDSMVVNSELLPGCFKDLTPQLFDEAIHDNESALSFAAKMGLIRNTRDCSKCGREMALCKFNNSCGFRWVCRRTEGGRRFTCSVRGMRKDTVLDDRQVGILTVMRIMYLFACKLPDTEIISKLDIGHVRSAKTILARLRSMVMHEMYMLNPTGLPDSEQLVEDFYTSGADIFGFIICWGVRYRFYEAILTGAVDPEGSKNTPAVGVPAIRCSEESEYMSPRRKSQRLDPLFVSM